MQNPENENALIFGIAGLTSTGKTRLGEQTVSTLRNEYDVSACFFSIGDIHRLLTRHHSILNDSGESAQTMAKQTLEETSIDIDDNGRIHLLYHGEKSRQTYENGNNAATVSGKDYISPIVEDFIQKRMKPYVSAFDFIGFDGRERRDAHLLFLTQAPDDTRVKIRRVEHPECAPLSDREILSHIHERDLKDKRFIQPLANEDTNVIYIHRMDPSHEANQSLAQKTAGIIVEFASGRLNPQFTPIHLSESHT